MHSRIGIVLLQVGNCKVQPRICSLFSTSSANVSWAKIPQERQKRKDSVLVVVHSWKPLLSGFHYHFWPILGLILQDANRAVQLVLPVQSAVPWRANCTHKRSLMDSYVSVFWHFYMKVKVREMQWGKGLLGMKIDILELVDRFTILETIF